MNTQVTTDTSLTPGNADTQFPAGAGIALAVLLGSVMWLGIFALMM